MRAQDLFAEEILQGAEEAGPGLAGLGNLWLLRPPRALVCSQGRAPLCWSQLHFHTYLYDSCHGLCPE